MPYRILIRYLFALTLLFGQAAAFAHAIGHLQQHEAGVPEPVCEVCVAHANLGSAVPACANLLPGVATAHPPLPVTATGAPSFSPRFAQARAPPASV
jgi:hypothetical protein